MCSVNLRTGFIAAVVFTAAAATVTLISGVAAAAPYSVAPVTEYMLLPKFCWGHFNDDLQGEEYYIPRCGVGTNHYCDGLLDLQRSKKARNATDRRIMLVKAKTNTVYTVGWLQREGLMASCPITSHVQQTLQEIELQFQLYHIK